MRRGRRGDPQSQGLPAHVRTKSVNEARRWAPEAITVTSGGVGSPEMTRSPKRARIAVTTARGSSP